MSAENLMYPSVITNHGVFRNHQLMTNGLFDTDRGCVRGYNDIYIGDPPVEQSPNFVGHIDSVGWPWCKPASNIQWTYHICSCGTKTPRQQVQDEILVKVKAAVEAEDLDKARELLDLAEKLKDL